jgi:hypothetical protein
MHHILERAFGVEGLDEVRETPKVIVWWLFVLIWVLAGIRFSREDILTTNLGYTALPTRSPFTDTGNWVAIFLFVLPVVSTILYVRTRKQGWLYIALASLAVDILFDMTYRIVADPILVPLDWGVEAGIALIQSVFIFTLGSEVALGVGIPLLIDLTPDAFYQFLYQLHRLFDPVLGGLRQGFEDEERYYDEA